MNQIINYFYTIRPLNVLLSGITVFIGAYILEEITNYITLITAIVVMLSCACANILNDLCDINTDKINKPDRPIVLLNNINFNYHLIFLLIFLLIWIIILSSMYFTREANAFLFFIFLLIVTYTPFFKGIPFIGNLIISFILSCVFIFPEVVLKGNFLYLLYYPALLTFLLTLIREIIKDIADIDGDKESGINTFPVLFGVHYSKYLLMIIISLLIAISIYPYYINIYNYYYLMLLVLLVQIPLIGCIFYLWKHPDSESCVTLAATTKYITIGGMITILATKLFN